MRPKLPSPSGTLLRSLLTGLSALSLTFGAAACRLGSNNDEKLEALKSGSIYDEDGSFSLQISVPAADALINLSSDSATYATSGTCSVEGATITLLIDSTDTSSQATCAGGVWSTSFDSTSLANGQHEIAARLTNSKGLSKTSSSVKFFKDSVLPTIAITSPAGGSYISATTDSASFAISGTCSEAGQSVSLLIDGVAASVTAGSCNGSTWAATVSTLSLSAGAHSFFASITSANGNPKSSDTIVITKDITAATVAISSPSNSSYINVANNSSTFAVSGTCNDSTGSVAVKVDGSSATSQVGTSCNGSAWSSTIDVTGLAAGAHTLTATITDPAGNSANTSSNTGVTKDVTAPTIAITSPSTNSYINSSTDSASFAVSGTCNENTQAVTVKVDGSASGAGGTCSGGTWSATINTTGLSQAAHSLTAVVGDSAANYTTSTAITVTRDVTAPTVAITYPVASMYINPHTNSATYSLSGTCSEASQSVTVKVNGSTSGSGGTCSSSAWSASIDTTALSNAAHTLSVVHADAAGNSTTSSTVNVTKDDTLDMSGTFARSSVANDPNFGTQVASGIARYTRISSATGILAEEGTTNILPANTNTFTSNRTDYDGAAVTVTGSQTDPFGGTSAYRIQTSGGTHVLKTYLPYGTSTNGQAYSTSIWIKNNSATTVKILQNVSGSSVDVTQAEGWKLVKIENAMGNGTSAVQIQIRAPLAGDSLDFYAMNPQVEAKTYATSYIAPGGARAAESFTVPATGSIQPSRGAVVIRAYVDGDSAASTVRAGHYLFDIGDSNTQNRIRIYQGYATPGTYNVTVTDNAGTATSASWSQTLATGWHLFGLKWSTAGMYLYVDGVLRASNTTINLPASFSAPMYIGSGRGGAAYHWNHPIDYAAFYQHAPTDAQMATFTNTGPTGADNKLDFMGATFTRATVATNYAAVTQAASGKERYVTYGNGTGLFIESGTTNLVANPGLETDSNADGLADNWVRNQAEPVFTLVSGRYGGNAQSMKITANSVSSTPGVMTDAMAVSGSTTYTLSFDYKMDRTDGYTFAYFIRDNTNSNYIVAGSSTTLSTSWATKTGSFTTAANTASISLYIFRSGGAATYDVTMLIDNAQIEAKNYATTLISGTRNADNLTIPTSGVLSATSGAVTARVMSFRSYGTHEQFIFDAGSTGSTGLFGSVNSSNGKFYIQGGNGSTTTSCAGTTVFSPFTWYTVEFRWSATELYTKVNGTTECSNTSFTNGISLYASGTVHIGNHGGTQRYLDGLLDYMIFENSDGSTQRLDFSRNLGQ